MASHPRPIAPHLQVYRPQLTSFTSILHRITGSFLALGILALVYHAVLGLQVVIEDYIHSHAAKITLLLLIQFAGIALAAAGIIAMLMITIYGG